VNARLSTSAFLIFLALFLVESESHLRAAFCIQNTLFFIPFKIRHVDRKSLVAVATPLVVSTSEAPLFSGDLSRYAASAMPDVSDRNQLRALNP
jgi:hypothetical protein